MLSDEELCHLTDTDLNPKYGKEAAGKQEKKIIEIVFKCLSVVKVRRSVREGKAGRLPNQKVGGSTPGSSGLLLPIAVPLVCECV